MSPWGGGAGRGGALLPPVAIEAELNPWIIHGILFNGLCNPLLTSRDEFKHFLHSRKNLYTYILYFPLRFALSTCFSLSFN